MPSVVTALGAGTGDAVDANSTGHTGFDLSDTCALQAAIHSKAPPVVSYLLSHGADPNKFAGVMQDAITCMQPAILRMLLDAGGQVNPTCRHDFGDPSLFDLITCVRYLHHDEAAVMAHMAVALEYPDIDLDVKTKGTPSLTLVEVARRERMPRVAALIEVEVGVGVGAGLLLRSRRACAPVCPPTNVSVGSRSIRTWSC